MDENNATIPPEDGRGADRTRDAERDSARAAALTAGSSDAETPRGATRRPRRGRTVASAALAAVSAVSIVVSAWALAGQGASPDGLLDTVEPSAQQPAATQQDAPSADGADASSDDAPAADATGEDAVSEAGAASSQAPAAAVSDDASASAQDAPSAASSTSAGGASSASSGSQGSSSAPEAPAEANTVTVAVSVSSSTVGNPVSGAGTFTLAKGATVYDALCALTTPDGSPTYIRAIGGLAEFDHGSQSGWKYSVNGVDPMVSCGSYVLSDGDVVAWRYVTSIDG